MTERLFHATDPAENSDGTAAWLCVGVLKLCDRTAMYAPATDLDRPDDT